MGSPWDGQPVGWLQLVALGILAWLLEACTAPKRAALLGWVFTTAWLCGTFWWLYISMHTYGGLNAALTVLAIVALAGVLALYFALACGVFKSLQNGFVQVKPANVPVNAAYVAIIFAALWMLAEMCRGIWFTGFGWGATAYAHLDGLAVLAKYVGAYGVGALTAFLAYAGAACLRRSLVKQDALQGELESRRAIVLRSVAGLALAAALWALVKLPGHQFSAAAGTMDVALLQGNIAQDLKFQPGGGIEDALRWYGEQFERSTATLVVAPETAIPILPSQLPDDYWERLTRRFGSGQQAVLVGIPLGSYSAGYTNSVIGIRPAPDGQHPNAAAPAEIKDVYQYHKHHLVPFGEFIPPLFKWFTRMMNIPLGDFNRGAVGQAPFEWQGQRLAPNVCYEDLFGEELGARFADPAKAPTIFVNLSNIGWFGNTVAIDQHLAISRMRAIEFERPFIRATNTGDTAIIDHTGRVTQALPRHMRGVLRGQVQGRSGSAGTGDGITPYAWWVSRFGLWPLWGLGLALVLLAWWGQRRRPVKSPHAELSKHHS